MFQEQKQSCDQSTGLFFLDVPKQNIVIRTLNPYIKKKCPNRPMCPHVYNIVYKMLKLWLKNNISHCYTRHCWMNHKSYPNNFLIHPT